MYDQVLACLSSLITAPSPRRNEEPEVSSSHKPADGELDETTESPDILADITDTYAPLRKGKRKKATTRMTANINPLSSHSVTTPFQELFKTLPNSFYDCDEEKRRLKGRAMRLADRRMKYEWAEVQAHLRE